MITVQLNANKIRVEPNTTLQQLLQQHALSSQTFAVAVNRKFVARHQYATTLLQCQDLIETIFPMQGG